MDNNYLKEEVFCQGLELNSFSELILKSESERMIPGFSLDVVEHDHKDRYLFATNYAKNKTVLDIACGAGYGSNLLCNKGGASKVIGVDLDAIAIRYAQHRFKSDNVTYIQSDAINFDFPETFDLITSFETIEHIPDYESYLQNILTLMKDDGMFLVSTPISNVDIDFQPKHNPYHVREWGFHKFQEVISEFFIIEQVFVQLYQNSFINEKRILEFNLENTRLSTRLKNLIKVKLLNLGCSPDLLQDWTSKTNYSQIEEFVDQFNVLDLGSKHTGYQILRCKKKI